MAVYFEIEDRSPSYKRENCVKFSMFYRESLNLVDGETRKSRVQKIREAFHLYLKDFVQAANTMPTAKIINDHYYLSDQFRGDDMAIELHGFDEIQGILCYCGKKTIALYGGGQRCVERSSDGEKYISTDSYIPRSTYNISIELTSAIREEPIYSKGLHDKAQMVIEALALPEELEERQGETLLCLLENIGMITTLSLKNDYRLHKACYNFCDDQFGIPEGEHVVKVGVEIKRWHT